jgi:hypothetical protein
MILISPIGPIGPISPIPPYSTTTVIFMFPWPDPQ